MSSLRSTQEHHTIHVNTERQALDLGCGKSVVCTTTQQASSKNSQPTISLHEGIVDTEAVNDYLAGKTVDINTQYLWCSEGDLSVAQHDGFNGFYQVVFDDKKTKQRNLFAQCAANPKAAMTSLVRMDGSSHMLFDIQDQPLPVALVFDYIQNRICESEYDLQAVARTLMLRTDVLVIHANPKSRRRNEEFYSKWERAVYPQDAIMNIPSYNCEDGRTQSVEFVWQPSVEDYRSIWDNVKQSQYPSTRLREPAMSLFGLEEFASLKNRYHHKHKM